MVDAYSIACSILENPVVSIPDTHYEIHQFRRHDRAIIHHQTERTYYLNGKAVCKNRHKRFEQKGDSLEEFAKVHPDLVSKLTVKKSRRYYNDPDRILPGAIFGSIVTVSEIPLQNCSKYRIMNPSARRSVPVFLWKKG